ncbi:hypothetical protein TW85_07820 [Marinomonas sp. S3726]|nr:hypothetical protein TW85_07820 [Marinomonas sp. S3726]
MLLISINLVEQVKKSSFILPYLHLITIIKWGILSTIISLPVKKSIQNINREIGFKSRNRLLKKLLESGLVLKEGASRPRSFFYGLL